MQHNVPALRGLLEARDYREFPSVDAKDFNFVLSDSRGRKIDVHSYAFDPQGSHIYGIAYPIASLTGTCMQRSSTAVGLVAQGVAAAVVPSLAIQKGAYPAIKVVALNEPVVSRTLVLVSRKTAHLSPAAQALYDMIGKQGQT